MPTAIAPAAPPDQAPMRALMKTSRAVAGIRRSLLFQRQQRPLALQPPAIAAQPAVAADRAVAGHQQRHRVGGAGPADGPLGGRLAEPLGDLAIGPGLAHLDAAQLLPDAE